VGTLNLQPDGKVLMGGSFTNVSGATRHYLARLEHDGTLDSGFDAKIRLDYGNVSTITTQADGRIVIGGEFFFVDDVPRNSIARLSRDGSLDLTFDPGIGPGDDSGFRAMIRDTAIQVDGRILVGGRFTSFDGVRIDNIARLLSDQGGQVEFTIGEHTFEESAGLIQVEVFRRGTLEGPASVDVGVWDGTATAGTDLVLLEETLTFAPGETNLLLDVRLLEDSLSEDTEFVVLALGNPVGGLTIGQQATTTISIFDHPGTPRSRFTSVTLYDDAQLRLVLEVPETRSYVLEMTADFVAWMPVQTNEPTDGECVFTLSPLAGQGLCLYRAYPQ
jgi:uncharacterized delta-60 repeat protein